jgi:hypothetical protein
MKQATFKNSNDIFNPIVIHDIANYMSEVGERKGSAPTRHYMGHRNQTGYTRIRQTKSLIIVEWLEY